MLKSASKEDMIIRSNSKVSMDIDNGDNSNPEKISLPNGKGSSNIKSSDSMIKKEASYGIVPCVNPK